MTVTRRRLSTAAALVALVIALAGATAGPAGADRSLAETEAVEQDLQILADTQWD